MTRFALIMLGLTAFVGAAITTASATQHSLNAPSFSLDRRISGGIPGGNHAFTPRPFNSNQKPNVSIPIYNSKGSPAKHAQKAFTKNMCEAIYRCCINSGGKASGCCDLYNSDKLCPY